MPKSTILGVLSALVKDSRQFKQRYNSCNCKFTIIQTTTILKSCISWCGDSETCESQYPKMAIICVNIEIWGISFDRTDSRWVCCEIEFSNVNYIFIYFRPAKMQLLVVLQESNLRAYNIVAFYSCMHDMSWGLVVAFFATAPGKTPKTYI
jgi:hypothetical protein